MMKQARLITSSAEAGDIAYCFEKISTTTYGKDSEIIAKKILGKYPPRVNYTVNSGDQIFFAPKGTLTRHDQNILKEKLGVIKVRSIDACKYAVVNNKFFESLVEGAQWDKRLCKKEELVKTLENLPGMLTDFSDTYIEKVAYKTFKDVLSSIEEEYVLLSSNSLRGLVRSIHWRTGVVVSDMIKSIDYQGTITADNYEVLKVFLNNKDKWISEEPFIKTCQNDTKFTQEHYDSIVKMLTAGPQDRELAVTMLGGFDVKKNINLMAKLWFQYSERITDCKGYRHAGFRINKEIFSSISTNSHGAFARSLEKQSLLTNELLQYVVEGKLASLNKEWGTTDSGTFIIEHISYKPESNEK